ncbi:rimO [Acrasis kona]|uniref:RimO n=1 Tax=Acrasis kona TaxID=1008807 RepID=A0AAW2YI33_9EUKA
MSWCFKGFKESTIEQFINQTMRWTVFLAIIIAWISLLCIVPSHSSLMKRVYVKKEKSTQVEEKVQVISSPLLEKVVPPNDEASKEELVEDAIKVEEKHAVIDTCTITNIAKLNEEQKKLHFHVTPKITSEISAFKKGLGLIKAQKIVKISKEEYLGVGYNKKAKNSFLVEIKKLQEHNPHASDDMVYLEAILLRKKLNKELVIYTCDKGMKKRTEVQKYRDEIKTTALQVNNLKKLLTANDFDTPIQVLYIK